MLVNLKKLKGRNKNRIARGIYEMHSYFRFNFENYLYARNVNFYDEYKPIVDGNDRYAPAYGVCDDPQQILDLAPELLTSKEKYVIGITKVCKKDLSVSNWRWRKWGKYIGTKERRHEYLRDETDIDQVYYFRILKVK